MDGSDEDQRGSRAALEASSMVERWLYDNQLQRDRRRREFYS